MPQLDALRAFAVGGVLVHHYFPTRSLGILAFCGVKLFFVLSGFLITGILLRGRETAEASDGNRLFILRQFYVRRFLRIFPLYYFVVGLSLFLNLESVREVILWLLTYTLNIYVVIQGYWVANVSHFWTLAVEEQFYILWPWLILFTPKRWLALLTCLVLFVGPLYRLFGYLNELNGIATYALTPACLDSLGLGALLAQLAQSPKLKVLLDRYSGKVSFPIGITGSAVLYLLQFYNLSAGPNLVLFDLFLALTFCSIIYSASKGFKGFLKPLLESRPLMYIGKISYGVYVFHPFVPTLIPPFLATLGLRYVSHEGLDFVFFTLITVVLASFSWFILEKPINYLKRHFAYSR